MGSDPADGFGSRRGCDLEGMGCKGDVDGGGREGRKEVFYFRAKAPRIYNRLAIVNTIAQVFP
jgi:hypothetical protein